MKPRVPWAMAVAVALSIAYLIVAPQTGDHAAQAFRTELFARSGPVIWDNYWFGGHYLPSYSLLSPALGAWVGFRLLGVVAVLGSVAMFSAIVERRWGAGGQPAAIWFAAAASLSLFTGQTTFALGLLLAIVVVFAAQRGRRTASLLLAVSVALASPVAALFLACCGFAYSLAEWPNRRGFEIAGASFTTAIAISFLFPGGGTFPYESASFIWCLSVTLLAAVFIPTEQRLIRVGLFVYAATVVLTFLIATPMGGNVNRLGVLLIGPLFLIAMLPDWRKRILPLVLVTPLIVYWQVQPAIHQLRVIDGDPAARHGFYTTLESTLGPLLERRPARVEVVPAASHWESAELAPDILLARGWERQTDRHLNGIFYENELNAADYRRWLEELAVGYVAIPLAKLDYAGLTEASLVRSGVSYLTAVPIDGPWQLYRVRDPQPIVERPAQLTSMTASGFEVTIPVPGTYSVRIRATPYWRVTGGRGCVSETPDGWTELRTSQRGSLTVEAKFSLEARIDPDGNCRG